MHSGELTVCKGRQAGEEGERPLRRDCKWGSTHRGKVSLFVCVCVCCTARTYCSFTEGKGGKNGPTLKVQGPSDVLFLFNMACMYSLTSQYGMTVQNERINAVCVLDFCGPNEINACVRMENLLTG